MARQTESMEQTEQTEQTEQSSDSSDSDSDGDVMSRAAARARKEREAQARQQVEEDTKKRTSDEARNAEPTTAISLEQLRIFFETHDAGKLFESSSPSDAELEEFVSSMPAGDIEEMLVQEYGKGLQAGGEETKADDQADEQGDEQAGGGAQDADALREQLQELTQRMMQGDPDAQAEYLQVQVLYQELHQ